MEAAIDNRPPVPTPRKNAPVNAEYEAKGRDLIRTAMKHQGVTVAELHSRLTDRGIEISEGGMANKISRGGFSSAFLLQCLDALDIDVSAVPKD
ncbi:DUF6471 domain-containing protein [Ahrensia sp. R2A130]|uniref:DUF6471 domain-containing protein n=1 Tax=Ahrensia sp. R2A130 TaxID=744979 RepID=UPI0001E0E073|nr:DUF6471 domain-containing protein [Ahrensia sp. R2A130]EFL89809.1 GMP synthase PP-ATPase subunit [Ahrensia sp. R2A130]